MNPTELSKITSEKSPLTLESGVYENTTVNGNIIISENNVILNGLTVNGSITVKGDNVSLVGCTVNAKDNAITSFGNYFVARNNIINSKGKAISLEKGSSNSLVAQNKTDGAIFVTGAYNCAVVLNIAAGFVGRGCTNLYVIDNKLDKDNEVTDNKYLVCDGNIYTSIKNEGNVLYNGDNLHDVDARAEVGAKEDLLPHTNKDLFMGMDRKSAVNDPSLQEALPLNEYIAREAARSEVVIVPPGAYTVTSTLNLRAEHSNTVLYAYGVYLEAEDYIKCIHLMDVCNFVIKGLTVGYVKQSAGQLQVLEKLEDNKLLVVSSAGFTKEFGLLDPKTFRAGGYFYHPGKHYQWTELGFWGSYTLVPNDKGEDINEDGTFVIQLGGGDAVPRYYSNIEKGELFSCRLNSVSDRTVAISSCTNVLLKDTVTYGYAGALCFVIGGTSRGVKFYRHHNLAHSAYEIDKETYDRYKALEEKYNVDLEVHIDEMGRYRGAHPRMGSVDATHVSGASEGLDATSTLFENACDDCTNQRGCSSALHKVIDNGDGTCTIVYKDHMPTVYYNLYKRRGSTNNPGINAKDFLRGERIFAYASNGRILCDAPTVSDAWIYEEGYTMYEEDFEYKGETRHMEWVCNLHAVKVRTEDVNLSALEGYNTEVSSPGMDSTVIVDNVSRNSAGFTFDNCMTRHNRGRVIIKTRNATVKNCTFKDNSYSGVVMSVETEWGESSVPCNTTVSKCIFDGVSREYDRNGFTKYAGLAIEGLGDRSRGVIVSENTIPAKNITVEGNIFRNVQNDYYVTVSAAQNVNITNNVFEPRDFADSACKSIFIDGCMNVNVSGNSFPTEDVSSMITASNYKNLFGSDVDGFFENNKEPRI